jgi:hypothetical protein
MNDAKVCYITHKKNAFLQKLFFFGLKNTLFAEIRSADRKIPYTLLQKSDSTKNFYPIFAGISATNRFSIFCNNANF